MNVAATSTVEQGKEWQQQQESKERLAAGQLGRELQLAVAANKAVTSKLDRVELQSKQFVGERQGSWELHYSNQEAQLRKKADKNKELLQKHQAESQVRVVLVKVV